MEKGKVVTIAENEPYLRQTSVPVQLDDPELAEDLKIIEDFCKQNEVMAMASVQLGIPKRLLYLKNTRLDIIRKMQRSENSEDELNYNEARVLINPVIISREGLTEYWEACASCGDNMGHVYRPYRIVVEYFDRNGNKHTETFEGFESTVLSHEYDHLDGILHIDIADQVMVKPVEQRKIWRQAHDYNILSKEGDYETLLNTKRFAFIKK